MLSSGVIRPGPDWVRAYANPAAVMIQFSVSHQETARRFSSSDSPLTVSNSSPSSLFVERGKHRPPEYSEGGRRRLVASGARLVGSR